jgi:hypothetical protein
MEEANSMNLSIVYPLFGATIMTSPSLVRVLNIVLIKA